MKITSHIMAEPPGDDVNLLNEVRQTMALATQMQDGYELSDEEFDILCDAILCVDSSSEPTK